MRHETRDLYEAAYLMAEGVELWDVRQEECGVVVFELEGATVEVLRENYARDLAITNIRRFQGALTRAKDVMFALLRAREITRERLERRSKYARERAGSLSA